MTRLNILGVALLWVAAAVVGTGCGGGGPREVKVTGSVVQGGKPLDGVAVSFVSPDPANIPSRGGRTDAAGKFEVKMQPASYTVLLSRLVDKKGGVPKESDDPSQDFTQLEASGLLKHSLPAKYRNPTATPFKVEIPPEDKELPPFEVTK